MGLCSEEIMTRAAIHLQRMYDSEINWKLYTFWDGGFYWELGDDSNGIKESGNAESILKAVEQLVSSALKHYPHSLFARHYNF